MNNKVFLSLLSSLLVLVYQFFKWQITNTISPFLSMLLWLVIIVFFILTTILAIVLLFKRKQWVPFSMQLITLVLLFVIPFSEMNLTLNFKSKKSKREDVVRLVENGTLKSSNSDGTIIHLPQKYKSASQDGMIILNKGNGKYSILFLTNRGILNSFSGFVYSPTNIKPSQGDFYGHLTEIKKMEYHWFFVSSQ